MRTVITPSASYTIVTFLELTRLGVGAESVVTVLTVVVLLLSKKSKNGAATCVVVRIVVTVPVTVVNKVVRSWFTAPEEMILDEGLLVASQRD